MKRPVRILLTVVAVIAVIVCIFCILFIVQYVRGKSVSDKLGSGVRSGQGAPGPPGRRQIYGHQCGL